MCVFRGQKFAKTSKFQPRSPSLERCEGFRTVGIVGGELKIGLRIGKLSREFGIKVEVSGTA